MTLTQEAGGGWPGRAAPPGPVSGWHGRGELLVSWPTESGLFASRGFAPTGVRGCWNAGEGTDPTDAAEGTPDAAAADVDDAAADDTAIAAAAADDAPAPAAADTSPTPFTITPAGVIGLGAIGLGLSNDATEYPGLARLGMDTEGELVAAWSSVEAELGVWASSPIAGGIHAVLVIGGVLIAVLAVAASVSVLHVAYALLFPPGGTQGGVRDARSGGEVCGGGGVTHQTNRGGGVRVRLHR